MPVYKVGLEDGRALRIDADSEDAALAGAHQFLQENPAPSPAKDTSYTGALQHGAANVVSGLGSTIKNYIDPVLGTDAGKSVQDFGASIAPDNYAPAYEDYANPKPGERTADLRGDAIRKLFGSEGPVRGGPIIAGVRALTKLVPNKVGVDAIPRTLVESAPGLATDVIAAGVTGNPLAAGVTYAARTAGPEAEARAAKRTGQEGAEPSLEDKIVAGGSTAAQAALSALGVKPLVAQSRGIGLAPSLAGLAKSGAAQGGTGTAQELVSQAGQTIGTPGGLQLDPEEAGKAGVLSGPLGAAAHTPKLARDLTATAKFGDLGGDLAEASTRVANRLSERGADLMKPKQARTAVDTVSHDIQTELSAALKDAPGFSADPDAANALARIASGRGAGANAADIAAIDSVANGGAGQQVRDLARQAISIERLKATGDYGPKSFKGGIGAMLERSLRRLTTPAAALSASGLGALGVPSGTTAAIAGAAMPHVPLALGVTAGAYALARGADKLLGTRSPAATFAQRFADPSVPVRRETASSIVAADPRLSESPTGPKIAAEPAPPWGYPAAAPERRANLVIDTGIPRLARGLERQHQQQFTRDATDALRQLARRSKIVAEQAEAQPRADTSSPQADYAPTTSGSGDLPTKDYIAREIAARVKAGVPPRFIDGYKAAGERRDAGKAQIAFDLENTVPYLGNKSVFLDHMRSEKTRAGARNYRDWLKAQVAPIEATAIDQILTDKSIDAIWKAK